MNIEDSLVHASIVQTLCIDTQVLFSMKCWKQYNNSTLLLEFRICNSPCRFNTNYVFSIKMWFCPDGMLKIVSHCVGLRGLASSKKKRGWFCSGQFSTYSDLRHSAPFSVKRQDGTRFEIHYFTLRQAASWYAGKLLPAEVVESFVHSDSFWFSTFVASLSCTKPKDTLVLPVIRLNQ